MLFFSAELQALLSLISRALGFEKQTCPAADWQQVENIARDQGVLWMLYMGAKAFQGLIPAERVQSWRGAMISSVMCNEQINSVQRSVLAWLSSKNIRSAVLKGTSCARYYLYPDARSLGDIDILVDQENLEALGTWLEEQGYTPSKLEHGFHVGYYGKDAVIEVHYAGTEVPDSEGGRIAGQAMEHFLDEIQTASIGDMSFPVLSDGHQALMLLLHMERHMMVGGIGLRQMCDWAVFVKESPSEHWQNGTLELLESCGLLTYAKVVTKTCADYLGLNISRVQWCNDISPQLTEAMIADVFRGGNMGAADEKGAGSLFTERRLLGRENQNRLKGLLSKLNRLSYSHWPITQKYKILLPLCWIYIPMRYMVRSARGLRPKKNAVYVLSSSNQRQKLYKALRLYEIKKCR